MQLNSWYFPYFRSKAKKPYNLKLKYTAQNMIKVNDISLHVPVFEDIYRN